MARSFNGTTQYLTSSTTPVTAYPWTVAGWAHPNSVDTFDVAFSLGDTGGDSNSWFIVFRGSVGDTVDFISRAAGTNSDASTSTTFTANTWHHFAAVATSATSRAVFLNGGGKGTNTTSSTPTGIDAIGVGIQIRATPNGWFPGRLAEIGLWNVALTDSEVLALSRGLSPLKVRPSNLVGYWPIYGVASPENNFILGGHSLSLVNSPTQIDHAPVATPFQRTNSLVSAASAGTVFQQTNTGSITATGALTKKTKKQVSGSISTSGSLIKKTQKQLSGAITATGRVLKNTKKQLSGSITPTGALDSSDPFPSVPEEGGGLGGSLGTRLLRNYGRLFSRYQR